MPERDGRAASSGAGTDTITIDGVDSLSGARHRVIPDRIETGTYAMAVAMTGGDVVLEGARADLLQSALDVLAQTGAEITNVDNGIRVRRNGNGIQPVDVTTEPFPGFPTDLQAQFMGLMTMAHGRSRITETIFENRFMHVQELARLGAHISLSGQTAMVEGVRAAQGRAGDGDRSARLGVAGDRRAWRPKARPSSTASTISTAASSGWRRSCRAAAPIIERLSSHTGPHGPAQARRARRPGPDHRLGACAGRGDAGRRPEVPQAGRAASWCR